MSGILVRLIVIICVELLICMLIYLELISLKNPLNLEAPMWRKFGHYDLCLHYSSLQGGALLPERWRAEVDAVLAGVAIGVAADTTSFNLSCDEDIGFSRSPDGKSVPIHFQVAAYQALLSSLLAPSGHRPPYLAVGLALFRNGKL